MMKIGIYDPYLDDLGGGEKYMMSMALCLAEKHTVSIFWDNEADLVNLQNRFSLDLSKVTRVQNIFDKKINFINRLRASSPYDILIILSDGSIPFTISKQLFLHIQQPIHIKSFSLKTKLKMLFVSSIFYNSHYTYSYNKKLFGNIQSEVIYPPVIVHAKEVQKENIIFHVGRFRVMNVNTIDYKKQQIMIDTYKEMVDKGFKNWKFVLATSIADTADLSFQKMLESAKGYPIEFLINKPNNQLWEYYNKAKIYWHASGYGEDLKAHPEYAEHFGISTVEAMSAGAVPVVINSGGQKEIITDGKNGYLWDTLDELQEKTKKIAHDEKILQSFAQESKIRAKDFSFETFSNRINALVNKA